jgi:surface antigen
MRYIVFIAAILIATPATAQAGTSICFHMFGSEARSAMPPYVMNALAAINDRPALDPSDRRLFSEALNRAMVRETGSVSEWGDPAGQNHGQVLAERTTSDKTHYADPSITVSDVSHSDAESRRSYHRECYRRSGGHQRKPPARTEFSRQVQFLVDR